MYRIDNNGVRTTSPITTDETAKYAAFMEANPALALTGLSDAQKLERLNSPVTVPNPAPHPVLSVDSIPKIEVLSALVSVCAGLMNTVGADDAKYKKYSGFLTLASQLPIDNVPIAAAQPFIANLVSDGVLTQDQLDSVIMRDDPSWSPTISAGPLYLHVWGIGTAPELSDMASLT